MANEGRRPSIVLVVLDTLTAHAAGLDRNPSPMPMLAAMAETGLHFRHAVANAPWTYPAHASLLTGLLPSEHGMDTSHQFTAWEQDDPLGRNLGSLLPPGPVSDPDLGERWLPAVLRSNGYETACVSNNPWVSRLTEMHHGFLRLRDPAAVRLPRWRTAFRSRRGRAVVRAAFNTRRAVAVGGDMLAADALRLCRTWLQSRDGDRPFFLFVNLIEAHSPYLTPGAPQAVRDVHASPRAVFQAMRLTEPRRAIPYNLGGLDRAPFGKAIRVHRALHQASAHYLDAVVGELHGVAGGAGGETVFCVTSDHGESFGEHGALLHGFTLDEEALHVPLVLEGGGIQAADRSETVDLRRVYATLLEAVGVAVPSGAAPSLVASDPPHAVAERERLELPAWAASSWPQYAARCGRQRAVYGDPWKLIETEDGTGLYDLSADQLEERDLSPEHPELCRGLTDALPPWPERTSPMREPRSSSLTEQEEREVADHLAGLGYLE